MSGGQVEEFGRYRVYEQLGMGGMARVDRAELVEGTGPPRPVALKRMLPHVAANEEMVKAFVREARLVSHLRHVNVAQTYEFGKVDDVHFIAMELVTGPTLRHVLKHCAQTTGPMPIPIALNILNQICDALDYAHNLRDAAGNPLGIIHRDVSPSNIIIDQAGVAKLIDFGIAKASLAGVKTVAGVVKGKFGYMAPEYLAGSIDARADLFAIGVIAHELLTNRPLFTVADDLETMRRLRTMPIQPPSQRNPRVPPEIDDIVMTALARDPDQRWQHATALRTAMTTLTRRLGAVCTTRQVIEWIAWALEQTEAPSMPEIELSYSNLQIESPTHAEPAASRAAAASREAADPRPRATSSPSIHQTLLMSGPPSPPGPRPSGTPARAITAQPVPSSPEPYRPGDISPGDSLTLRDATELSASDDSLTLRDATELSASGDSLLPGGYGATLIGPGAAAHGGAASRQSRPLRPLGGSPPPRPPSVPPVGGSPPPPRPPSVPPVGSSPPYVPPVGASPPPRPPTAPPIPQPQVVLLPQPILPDQSLPDHDLAEPLPPPPLADPSRRAATIRPDAPPAAAPPEHRRAARTLVILALVLLAAGVAAAGVYLVLHLPA